MRAVEDDHVDRPDVQARQRVELTGTNRSTGLIALMIHVRVTKPQIRTKPCLPDSHGCRSPERLSRCGCRSPRQQLLSLILRRSGGLSEEPRPDPIPNSAVKLLSAYGTVSQDPGESVAAGPAKDENTLHDQHHTTRPPQEAAFAYPGPAHTRARPCRGVEQPGSSSGS